MNRNATCTITCTFKSRTAKAIKVHVVSEGKFFWLPLSQIPNMYFSGDEERGDEVSVDQMEEDEEYQVRVPLWLACKLLQCDDVEELRELELSYLEID